MGSPIGEFAAARTCCASRFATLQLEHECQLIPFSLCASQVRLLLYGKKEEKERTQKHKNHKDHGSSEATLRLTE